MDNPFDILMQEFREMKAVVLSDRAKSFDSEPIYLKIDKAAEFLSTTQNALRVMVHKGHIDHIKKNGKLFFRRSDLVEWFESGRVNSRREAPEDILIANIKKRS